VYRLCAHEHIQRTSHAPFRQHQRIGQRVAGVRHVAATELASSLHRAVSTPLLLLRRRQRHSLCLLPVRDAMLLVSLARSHPTRGQRLQSKLAGVCNRVVTPGFLLHPVGARKASVHRYGTMLLVVCCPVPVEDRR
jgi:hypothetical protein